MSQAQFGSSTDYKILIPKTALGAGLSGFNIPIPSAGVNNYRVRLGLRNTSGISTSSGISLKPYSVNHGSFNYMYQNIVGVGPPVASVAFNGGGNGFGIPYIQGTDAPANIKTVIEIDVFDAYNTQFKSGFYKWNSLNLIAASNVGGFGYFNDTCAFVSDAFHFDIGANILSADSWYELIKLG